MDQTPNRQSDLRVSTDFRRFRSPFERSEPLTPAIGDAGTALPLDRILPSKAGPHDLQNTNPNRSPIMRMTAVPPTATDERLAVPSLHYRNPATRDAVPPVAAAPCSTLPAPWRAFSYSADEVAALPAEKIFVMSRQELVGVISSVRGGHLRPGVIERLPQMDGETLRRLVFLTRRFCRNQQRLLQPAPLPSVIATCLG